MEGKTEEGKDFTMKVIALLIVFEKCGPCGHCSWGSIQRLVSDQRSRCTGGFPILGQVKAVLFSTGEKVSKADFLIV